MSGAIDFMYKPIDPQVLRSKVEAFLDIHNAKIQLSQEVNLRKLSEDKAIFLAEHDQLTGLGNRRLFHKNSKKR
ncbi:MAG: hypothetical protein Q9M40_14805 [Sulfurimonas sp.]|nr:hypothetical protein [Sulfurimonas sp.]